MKWFPRKMLMPGLLSGMLVSKKDTSPHDTVPTEEEQEQTGWNRLKNVFFNQGLGSPQTKIIYDGATMSFFIGFAIGGISESKEAYLKFIQENMVTQFKHHLEAKRAIQDAVTVGLAKGGWRVGWRLSLFTTTLLTILLSMNTYREKSSVIDFTTAGAATCGLYKLKDGPKPAIGGSVLGAGLGTLSGVVVIGLMSILGITFEDIYTNEADKLSKCFEAKQAHFKKKRTEDEEMRKVFGKLIDKESEETVEEEAKEETISDLVKNVSSKQTNEKK